MRSRSAMFAVLAWLAVVAVGSTVVWVVISRAGNGIATTADPGVVVTSSSGAGPTPPTSASSVRPSQRPPSSGALGPVVERRTWQGVGGLVIAECRDTTISLVSSSADPGFRVEVGDRGPEELELKFEGQGEEGRETELKASCRGGIPEFEVTSSGD